MAQSSFPSSDRFSTRRSWRSCSAAIAASCASTPVRTPGEKRAKNGIPRIKSKLSGLIPGFTKLHVLLAIFWGAVFTALANDPHPDELVRAVRTQLPSGWSASYNQSSRSLEILRNEPLRCTSAAPNLSIPVIATSTIVDAPEGTVAPKSVLPGETVDFSYAFEVSSKVPEATYQKLASENLKTQREASALYDDLVKRRVSHRFDSFHPSTDEERKLVERYNRLRDSLHRLPDFYFQGVSLGWAYNSPANPAYTAVNLKEVAECDAVRDLVTGLFFTYTPATSDPLTPTVLPKIPEGCRVHVYGPFDKPPSYVPAAARDESDWTEFYKACGVAFAKGGFAYFHKPTKTLIIAGDEKDFSIIDKVMSTR